MPQRTAQRVVAVVAAATLVGAGCGARLSKQQLAALGDSGNSGASGLAPGAGPASSSSTTIASGAVSTGGAPSSARVATTATTAASTGRSSAAGAGGGSGGGGSGGAGGSGASARSGGATPAGHSGGAAIQGVTVRPGSTKVCPAGAPSSDPGVTATAITIGNVSTVAGGPVPGLFAGARKGTQAAVNYVNSTGGVCGRKLVLKADDDNFDTGTNKSDTETLSKQVLAFAGSFSLNEQGGASVLAGTNIPDVGVPLTAQRFDLPNNFSPTASPPTTGYLIGPYKYFAQKLGPGITQHMAIFMENNGVAQTAGEAEMASLQRLGYKFVVQETSIEPTQNNFSNEINEMKSKGVKGVVFQATAQIIGDMASQMYQAGFSVPFANWSPTAYDPAFLQAAGPGANGAILTSDFALFQGEDQAPAVQAFDEFYKATNNSPPDLFGFYGWLSVILLVQGLNAGGAPTRNAALAGLKTITSFNGNGLIAPDNPAAKQPPTCWVAIDVRGGRFVRDPASPSGFTCNPGGYG